MSENKNTINLIYKLEGNAIDDGIDVFELAPVLLSVGSLIKASYQTIYPGKKDIAVNIKPFEKGSFIIDIALFAQTNWQQILDFTNTDAVKQIKEVLEWVGIIATTGTVAGGSLLWLIRKLKKPPVKIEKINENEYRYFADESVSITVNGNVHNLYQNTVIQQTFPKTYLDLLEKIGIDKISSYIKNEEADREAIVVGKDDVTAFKSYAGADLSLTSEFEETTFEVLLSPKRGSFEAERDNWSFRMGASKDQIITATIKDENFLEQVKSGKIKPHFKDLLKASVKMKQEIKENEIKSATYEIMEVIEYRPAPPPPLQEPLV